MSYSDKLALDRLVQQAGYKIIKLLKIMESYAKYILPKLAVLILLLLGTIDKSPCKLTYLITAGIISGIYNGYYNDVQWRAQSVAHKDKKLPEECLHNKPVDAPYRAHQMFNHTLGVSKE